MGAESSKAKTPVPEAWIGLCPAGKGGAQTAVISVSDVSVEAFLAATAPIPELSSEAFDFDVFAPHAQKALEIDKGLTKRVDRLVPKRVTEKEFWRLYFCNVYSALTLQASADAQTAAAGDAELALSVELLERADDVTSARVIESLASSEAFQSLAKKEMNDILQRDAEDDDKLALGIKQAVDKGVVPADPLVEEVYRIEVHGKSADDVAATILGRLGDAPQEGCVLVLQGLSGTGKGTTVAKLQAALQRAVCWSNGNVFRSLTLLAVSACEERGVPFSTEVLTPDFIASLVSCLEFGKFDGKFDIHVTGHGHDCFVSQVANTLLKEPKVGKNIPTVAEASQGEVILFAAAAAEAMRKDGMNVLMEGRAQTLNYVRTPHRFELCLAEPIVIGERRAAQRVVFSALQAIKLRPPEAVALNHKDVLAVLHEALGSLA